MWSAMAVIGIFAPLVGSKFYKKKKEKKFILISISLWALIALSVIFVREMIFAFVILLSLEFFDHVKNPTKRVYFHRFIPDKMRASVGSVEGMLFSIIAIVSLPLVGLTVDLIGPQYTIFLSGLLAIPAIIIFYRIKENKVIIPPSHGNPTSSTI
jgi:predicted MFS family arabinose efflux permease